jgi:hypothetical protein
MKERRMTFAPGWTQKIATDTDRERDDLLSYISDTYKSLYGYRPRGETSDMTIEDLRTQADSLQKDVLADIELMKVLEARKRRNKADHRRAMKYYLNLKPRSNAMEIAMRDAMDAA